MMMIIITEELIANPVRGHKENDEGSCYAADA
jgi:hypothetical protein